MKNRSHYFGDKKLVNLCTVGIKMTFFVTYNLQLARAIKEEDPHRVFWAKRFASLHLPTYVTIKFTFGILGQIEKWFTNWFLSMSAATNVSSCSYEQRERIKRQCNSLLFKNSSHICSFLSWIWNSTQPIALAPPIPIKPNQIDIFSCFVLNLKLKSILFEWKPEILKNIVYGRHMFLPNFENINFLTVWKRGKPSFQRRNNSTKHQCFSYKTAVFGRERNENIKLWPQKRA